MIFRKPCKQALCTALAIDGSAYCGSHQPVRQVHHHKYDSLYANVRWRKIRKNILLDSVVCAVCGDEANEVDHIVPHRGDVKLFYDMNNLQALCKSCHSVKTAREVNGRK